MALSKALRHPHMFTVKGSGVGNLTTTNAFVTAVNSAGSTLSAGGQLQWKLKELCFERGSDTDATTVSLYLYDTKTTKKYLLLTSSSFSTSYYTYIPTLATGELIFDADAELRVESSAVNAAANWTLRVTGMVL